MTHGSLFSGIGGFDLAAEWMGWENVFHCEINKYCQKILKQHFPESILYEDIKSTDFIRHRSGVDVLTGGFPCQPYSQAGLRKGKEDDRHLWPEMLRAIKEIQPTWVVGENVLGLINWSGGLVFDEVQTDLETEGYEVFPYVLPACSQDAPHRRDRVWFVAYSNSYDDLRKKPRIPTEKGSNPKEYESEYRGTREFGGTVKSYGKGRINDGLIEYAPDTNSQLGFQGITKEQIPRKSDTTQIQSERGFAPFRDRWSLSASRTCGNHDGIPNVVDRIKALGNAVVPQVVYQIFKAIEQYEQSNAS